MSAHAIAGLGVLNTLYLVSGLAVTWLARGFSTWNDVARLAGAAYLVGVVVSGSIWTLLLVVGVPHNLAVVVGLPIVVTLGAGIGSRACRRDLPQGAHAPRGRVVVTAVGISAAALLLAGFFRGARLSGLYWWDAWSFWVPKAKAIYQFGELDTQFFTTLPGPSYPPLIPVLDAAAFHAMGSADVVTLHLQYWLFAVGFVWALAGLLAERVPDWILWPFILLVLIAPRIGERFLVTEADLFLDYLFVLAGVLVFGWTLDGERWRLVLAILMMSGMCLTKREGLLLGAVLIVAALMSTAREWRSAWPRLGIAVPIVAVVAAPWRIWYLLHGVEDETSSAGLDPTENAERLWPSIRLAFDVLFSSNYWSVLIPVAFGALVLALVARAFTGAVFFGSLVLLVTLGGGWITWAIPELEITQEAGANPIVRYMGAAALVCAAASPLLLSSAWTNVTDRGSEESPA